MESRRIKNIAPEEMWRRVTECTFPTYSGLAFDSHITGTVDIALIISPEGNLASYRVLGGSPLLVTSAMDAIRQWKFQPDAVDGEVVWTRVRALVRFNSDGTTVVDLARGLLPDNFGDPGTTRSAEGRLPRPASAPECKSVQPWTGAQAKEIEASEVSPGFYKNNYFGLTFHFPSDWQVADRDTLNLIDANKAKSAQAQFGPMPAYVQMFAFPSYMLFFARTDGPIGSSGPSVQIWAEKEPFIRSADQYFPNAHFLTDKTADSTRGPTGVEVSGTKYYRGDRWGKVEGRSIYQVRLVTYARDLILAIDVAADTAASAEQLVKSLEGIRIIPTQ
jgi:TonB family protein